MTLDIKETIIAGGGPEDYPTVRHLVLRGSQIDIGRHLAAIAGDRHGMGLMPSSDSLITRVNREYMQQNWPTHYQRMLGAAEVFEVDLLGDQLEFGHLFTLPGCSNVYYPNNTTANGHAMFSRNYDFPVNPEGLPASTTDPYLMEIYPDEGYPSLFMCAYDLLGIATDGINSEGLTMALLSDNETGLPLIDTEFPANCCYNFGDFTDHSPGVGIWSAQLPRYILETCKDAHEAKEKLLTTMHYYIGHPLHYIVGDRHGDGFVFEGMQQGNKPLFHDCGGAPLPVTNHPLREHEVLNHESVTGSVERLETVKKRLAAHNAPLDMDFIRANAECVAAVQPVGEGQYAGEVPARTLWHGYYDLEERSLTINYVIRDTGDEAAPVIHRSDDLHFQLRTLGNGQF